MVKFSENDDGFSGECFMVNIYTAFVVNTYITMNNEPVKQSFKSFSNCENTDEKHFFSLFRLHLYFFRITCAFQIYC